MTPCRRETVEALRAGRTPRDWTRSRIPVEEQREMVAMCEACVVRHACFEAGLAEGVSAVGIWGGVMFRGGRWSNPRESAPVRRSTVAGVHFEKKRGKWKAYGHTSRGEGRRRFVHIGYFDEEDDAIRAAEEWRASVAA